MAGLDSLISDTTSSTTTLPSWYDTAQQNVVSQATSAAAETPKLEDTVAGKAIENLSGAANPFLTAQGQLSQIGSGAANPWITDATTGKVTPDTSTALGGLFAAQNQMLNEILPETIAPAQATAIGSGNFGSLRGQTAVDTAKANALSDLYAKQMSAALQNQQTGVEAAKGLGTVGSQGTSTMTTLGQAQQASPLTGVANLAEILGAVRAPATVTQSEDLSPLSELGALLSAAGGTTSGLNSLIGSLFPYQTDASGNVIKDSSGNPVKATLGSAFSGLGDLLKGSLTGAFDWFSSNVTDDAGGSSVDQSSVDSFLEQYPEYGNFFASMGYDVADDYIDTSGGDVQGGDVEFQ